MIHVGYDNYVRLDSIRAVGHPGSAPTERLVRQARTKGLLIDFSAGRRYKAVLILADGYIVASHLSPETVAKRVRGEWIERERQVRGTVPVNPGGGTPLLQACGAG